MEILSTLIDIFFHIDENLNAIIGAYGGWTYALLFAIIFCETGLVVTPFLPGDSLLFAVGTFAALGSLNLAASLALLITAAVIGDTVNYWLGRHTGPKIFNRPSGFFFHRDHLLRAEAFYKRHGGKAIILARFMPIIRTFAPFVAGIGKMQYAKFVFYNITGGVTWVSGFILAGYFFGNLPWVQKNFHYVILGIILVSFAPAIYKFIRAHLPHPARNLDI